jgi:putative radical SAM enzyme (TIGR03279 family)
VVAPVVVSLVPDSPAERAGFQVGDQVLSINGSVPRDVLQWRWMVDEADLEVDLRRGGVDLTIEVPKLAGETLGAQVQSALFDQVRTCDNHCAFCFIYQLPPGMRKSLYLKDDDYRLSFLYGNFTTLTRFTELDFERVLQEGISPLHVSIHATDPDVRADMLRNRRGATSLRWLRQLLDHGVEVHGQVVVCPGVNDGAVLEDTLAGVFDRYSELASVAVVPLGVSRYNNEPTMRPHTQAEARDVVARIADWQQIFLEHTGRRMVFAADEYYLLADLPFPEAETYEGFSMHEDGIGMARTFALEFSGQAKEAIGPQSGFFSWVDGAGPEGYRAVRAPGSIVFRPSAAAPIGIVTSSAGAAVLRPLVASLDRSDVRIIEVENHFFGGNTCVTGLIVGADLQRVLQEEPIGHRYVLPDVCLSEGRFLDGLTPADLPRPVEIIATNGIALRHVLEGSSS